MNEDFRTYTNISNNYQLVADCKDIIFIGSKQDCINELMKMDISESNYHHLKVLKPSETIEGYFAN